jgi:hypothetical protein
MMDQELEHFKQNINIADVAESNGWALHERSTEKWPAYQKDGATILVWKDSSDGHYLYKKDEKTGSIIDFCQNEMSLSLGKIRQYLRTYTPSPSQPATQNKKASSSHSVQSVANLTEQWNALPVYSGSYLRNRGIKAETVELFNVRQDPVYGNACFKHQDIRNSEVVGWEEKNAGYTGFSKGGSRSHLGIQLVGKGKLLTHIIVTETTIDLMSFYQLHSRPEDSQQFAYISTAGTVTTSQKEMLSMLIAWFPDVTLILAQDNDAKGEKMVVSLQDMQREEKVARLKPPEGKDWNECLQGRIRAAQQAKEPQKAVVEAEAE